MRKKKPPTLQCIHCRKQRRCLLVCVYIPAPDDENHVADLCIGRTMTYDESLRIAICRACLRLPLPGVPLTSYIAENAL